MAWPNEAPRLFVLGLCLAGSLAVWSTEARAQLPADAVRTIDADGIDTRVATLGLDARSPGEPVIVLFGGAAQPLEDWGSWLDSVGSVAPVIAYDRPGMGSSSFDGRSMEPASVAQHLDAVLGRLDVDGPFILAGHSWGGPLALYYAGRRSSDVVGLVYLDPMDPWETPLGFYITENEDELERSAAAEREAIRALDFPPGFIAGQEAGLVFKTTPVAQRGLPPDPDVPTAVVLGARRPSAYPRYDVETKAFYEAAMTRRFERMSVWAASLPNARLYLTTDAGHLVYQDSPDLALEAVRWVVDASRRR